MVSFDRPVTPLTIISKLAPIGQNPSGETGANVGGQHLSKGGGDQFQPGKEMSAKVLAGSGQGRYTVEVGGQRLEIRSQTPLQVGQQFNVLVQDGENGIVLSLKSVDARQFLSRTLATGGSNHSLGMIFGQGLAAQAGKVSVSDQHGFSSLQKGGPPLLVVPPVIDKMTVLQQNFVDKSAPALSASVPGTAQISSAVQQFTDALSNQITPLLSEGRTSEAMAQLASGLRSLALFFPPQAGGFLPEGLNHQQQQIYQAFTLLQQSGHGIVTTEKGEAAFNRVLEHLQSQLTPMRTNPGQDISGPGTPQSAQAMLSSLSFNLLGMQSLIQIPAAFHNQPRGSSVFKSGLDGLFAYHLTLGMTGDEASVLISTGREQSSGTILQQLVNALGLDMEKLLAQGNIDKASSGLKFQLLQQLQDAQGQLQAEKSHLSSEESMKESGVLRQIGASHQALQSLNFLQVLQANLDRQGAMVVPLPVPFLEQGYLLLEENDPGNQEEEVEEDATRFSVLMKLSSLGNVRVDVLQIKENVYVRFHTESKEISELIQGSHQELRTGLNPKKLQGLSYASESAGDPLAVLLQKCENEQETSLFRGKA